MKEGDEERDRGFSIAIATAALVPRLAVALNWAVHPVWDGIYYDLYAKRIAEGFGYSEEGGPVSHYPVGYSAFLAPFYRVFGSGPHVAPVVNAIVGALLVLVVHRLARLGTTRARARLAAVLTAAHPGLIAFTGVVMSEPLATFGMFLAAWIFAATRERQRLAGVIGAGVVIGLATLVRPTSLLAAPALLFLEPSWRAHLFTGAKSVAVAGLAAALVVAPWTARNCKEMDGCALVSTNGGWNLAIGAFPRATGRFETLRASDACPIVTGQVQQDRCWFDEGLRWIKDDPKRWLGLAPKKLGFTFDHESFPINYYAEAHPKDDGVWPEERRTYWRGLLSDAHRTLLMVAALGVVAFPVQRRNAATIVQASLFGAIVALAIHAALSPFHPFWPLVVLLSIVAVLPLPGRPAPSGLVAFAVFTIASLALTHVVFFGEDRYHVPAIPALCLLAASALRYPRRAAQF